MATHVEAGQINTRHPLRTTPRQGRAALPSALTFSSAALIVLPSMTQDTTSCRPSARLDLDVGGAARPPAALPVPAVHAPALPTPDCSAGCLRRCSADDKHGGVPPRPRRLFRDCPTSAPQPVFLALDRYDHLIEMPFVCEVADRPPLELVGEFQAKLSRPF